MIELEHLTHRYDADSPALDGVSLEIAAGECFGLIGANAAGKTTTLKILATLLAPTTGTAAIDGLDVVRSYRAVRRRIGYMPETLTLLPELTVEEYLDYASGAYGFRGAQRRRRVEAVISLMDLEGIRGRVCEALSRGMQQRVGLARAVVHDPPVLILDEPTSGLDPAARMEFRRVMRELTGAGKTIVVSSHVLSELSGFCTSLGILDRGRLAIAGRIDEIARRPRGPREIEIGVEGDPAAVAGALRGRPGIDAVEVEGSTARLRYTGDSASEILRLLVQAGIPVVSFSERRTTLEDIFLEVGAFDVG